MNIWRPYKSSFRILTIPPYGEPTRQPFPAVRRVARHRRELPPEVSTDGIAELARVPWPVDHARLHDHERETAPHHAELGVPKGVYTSTLAVFGDTRGKVVDETYRPDRRYITEYDRTKAAAHFEVAEPLSSNTFLVPSTFTARPWDRFLPPILYQPATWNKPSTPVMGARMPSLSVTSPLCTRTPRVANSDAFPGARTTAVTSCPAATSARTRRPSTKPVAPVTSKCTDERRVRRYL